MLELTKHGFRDRLSELGLPSEIWTNDGKFAAFLNNPVDGNRATFHQQCLNSAHDGLGELLQPGTGEYVEGIGTKTQVSRASRHCRRACASRRWINLTQLRFRTAAFDDFIAHIYDPLSDALIGVITKDSRPLLNHVRDSMRAQTDGRPDNRLRAHWLGTSDEALELTLAWGKP